VAVSRVCGYLRLSFRTTCFTEGRYRLKTTKENKPKLCKPAFITVLKSKRSGAVQRNELANGLQNWLQETLGVLYLDPWQRNTSKVDLFLQKSQEKLNTIHSMLWRAESRVQLACLQPWNFARITKGEKTPRPTNYIIGNTTSKHPKWSRKAVQ